MQRRTRDEVGNRWRRFFRWALTAAGVCLAALAGLLLLVPSVCMYTKEDAARTDLVAIQSGLRLYFMKTGRYPDSASGLRPLVDAQIIEQTTDPWGNEYVYRNEGGNIVVISYGADGEPGGEGSDADISSASPQHSERHAAPPQTGDAGTQ